MDIEPGALSRPATKIHGNRLGDAAVVGMRRANNVAILAFAGWSHEPRETHAHVCGTML